MGLFDCLDQTEEEIAEFEEAAGEVLERAGIPVRWQNCRGGPREERAM